MAYLLRGWLLWQLLILPARVAIWMVLLLVLAGTLLGQALLSALRRSNRVGAPPVPFLLLCFRQGTIGGRFDKRFVLFHPAMNFEKVWGIVVQGRSFETTFDEVLVCRRDQVAIRYLGHFDWEEEIEPRLLDDPPTDYVLVPDALARPETGLFAALITNQAGFGLGIQNGDKLIFRDVRVMAPSAADAVLRRDATIRTASSSETATGDLGVLVGAISPSGVASPLQLQDAR